MLDTLRSLGYHPYILLEEWEQALFTRRFEGYTLLAALDWPPRAWLSHSTRVLLFDPADRDAAIAGQMIRPEIVY
jgi:hypothetical protein